MNRVMRAFVRASKSAMINYCLRVALIGSLAWAVSALLGGCPAPNSSLTGGNANADLVNGESVASPDGSASGNGAEVEGLRIGDVTIAAFAGVPTTVTLAASEPADFAIETAPLHGTLSAIAHADSRSATIEYVVESDYQGPDQFQFRASTGSESGVARVSISVYPEVRFGVSPTQASRNLTFVGTAVSAHDGDVLPEATYRWTFGDTVFEGPLSSHREVSRIFSDGGAQIVRLSLIFAGVQSPVDCRCVESLEPQQTVIIDPMVIGTVHNDSGAPIGGVALGTSDGRRTVTLADGSYQLEVPFGWTGSVTPSLEQRVFDPIATNFSDLVADKSNVDFIAQGISALPVASDQVVTTREDTALQITLNGSSPHGEDLFFTITDLPAHGTLGVLDNSGLNSAVVTYTPSSNFYGADFFKFETRDSSGNSAAATVSVTVESVNDVPVISNGDAIGLGVAVNSSAIDAGNRVNLSAVDVDAPIGSLEWSIPVPASHGVAAIVSGSPSGSAGSVIVSYMPQAGYSGVDSFSVQVTDGLAASDAILVTVGVGGHPISGRVTRVVAGGGSADVSGLPLQFTGSGASAGLNYVASTASDGTYSTVVAFGWSGAAAAQQPEDWSLQPPQMNYVSVSSGQVDQDFLAARNYYVDPSGDDSAAGSFAQPFRSVQRPANLVQPGDTTYIRGGTYTASGYVLGDAEDTPVLKVTVDGTAAAPIRFRNYANEAVLLDARGINSNAVLILSNYIEVSRMTFANCKREGAVIYASWRTSGSAQPPTGPPVFTGTPTGRQVTGSKVSECIAHNCSTLPTNFFAGFLIRGQCSFCSIENCVSYDNGIGVDMVEETPVNTFRTWPQYAAAWPDSPTNCTIRGCVVYQNQKSPENSDGVGGRYVTNCLYEDNISYGNADDNFDTVGASYCIYVGNVAFNANPLGTPDGDGNGMKVGTRRGGGNTVRNNISFLNPRAGFDNDDGSTDAYLNNLAYRNQYGMLVECDRGPADFRNNLTYLNVVRDITLSQDCPNAPPFTPTHTDYNYWGDGIPPINPCSNQRFDDAHSRTFSNSTWGLAVVGAPGFVAAFDNFSQVDLSAVASVRAGDIQALNAALLAQIRGGFTPGAGSPCINAGTDVGTAYQGSAPDIGPVETP